MILASVMVKINMSLASFTTLLTRTGPLHMKHYGTLMLFSGSQVKVQLVSHRMSFTFRSQNQDDHLAKRSD